MGKPLNDECAVEYGVGDQSGELGHVELYRICENQVSVSDGKRGGDSGRIHLVLERRRGLASVCHTRERIDDAAESRCRLWDTAASGVGQKRLIVIVVEEQDDM